MTSQIQKNVWENLEFFRLRVAVDSLIHLQLFYCYHLLQFLFMAAEFFNSSGQNSRWNSDIVTSQVRTIICKAENLVRYMRAAVAFLSCLSASGLAMWKTHIHYGTTETLKSFGVTSLKYSEKIIFEWYPFLSSEQKLLVDVWLSNLQRCILAFVLKQVQWFICLFLAKMANYYYIVLTVFKK